MFTYNALDMYECMDETSLLRFVKCVRGGVSNFTFTNVTNVIAGRVLSFFIQIDTVFLQLKLLNS